MTHRPIGWIGPGFTAMLAAVVYGPFGIGRDFGALIVSLFFVFPALGVVLLIAGAWLAFERSPRQKMFARSIFLSALAPALLIPGFWYSGDLLIDPARYAIWATPDGRYFVLTPEAAVSASDAMREYKV